MADVVNGVINTLGLQQIYRPGSIYSSDASDVTAARTPLTQCRSDARLVWYHKTSYIAK